MRLIRKSSLDYSNTSFIRVSQVNGPDKGGRVSMYGFGVYASDIYEEMPSRRKTHKINMASYAEIENLKQRSEVQSRQMEEQSRQIEEQNKQIQELLKLCKQRPESNNNVADNAQVLSSSSYHPTNSRRHSITSINRMPLRVGSTVFLKSMVEPSRTIAVGRLHSLDPSKSVEGVELGKNWGKVHINVIVDMNEELLRPLPECTVIGEVLGRTIAWPRHLVEIEED